MTFASLPVLFLPASTTASLAMLLAIAGVCLGAPKAESSVFTTSVDKSLDLAGKKPWAPHAASASFKASQMPPADSEYTRVVYNRVPQCGSSILIELAEKLAVRNNFTLVVDDEFKPNAKRIGEVIGALPPRTFYVNHCGFWPAAPPDVAWINLLRDPVARTMSGYYYKVDPAARGEGPVKEALQELQQEKKCGCFKREFDMCVRQRRNKNCPLDMSSAASYFCSPDEACSIELAHARATSRYAFVALADEMVRSVASLEAILPSWFAGASELFSEMKDTNMASTTERNPLTGTTMEGCVSNAAKHMLLEVETNRYELDFFEEIKDLFWRRVASHPKRSKLRTSVWMDFP
jgi:hypothetical protein